MGQLLLYSKHTSSMLVYLERTKYVVVQGAVLEIKHQLRWTRRSPQAFWKMDPAAIITALLLASLVRHMAGKKQSLQ